MFSLLVNIWLCGIDEGPEFFHDEMRNMTLIIDADGGLFTYFPFIRAGLFLVHNEFLV